MDGSGSTDDHGIVGYTWNFGDASAQVSSVASSTTHNYPGKGKYKATLTVTDAGGLSASVTQNVDINH
jgi:serine protease